VLLLGRWSVLPDWLLCGCSGLAACQNWHIAFLLYSGPKLYSFSVRVVGRARQFAVGQTDRHTDRETFRQASRQTDRLTNSKAAREHDRKPTRQTDRQTDRQAGKQAGEQADRQTERQGLRSSLGVPDMTLPHCKLLGQ